MKTPGISAVPGQRTLVSPEFAFELYQVSKRFDAQPAILQDFNLAVKPGEFVSVVGESGCGKTTLLRLVAGLEAPGSGEIRVEGQVVQGPGRQVGMVFQKPVLLKWRTVLENVLLPAQLHRFQGQAMADARQEAVNLLEKAGLGQALNKYPHQLSGGMQSRVALARALLLRPRILLCDEPFAALDAITRERMADSLLELWRGSQGQLTVLFVTHDLGEAVYLSDRLLLMRRNGIDTHLKEFKIDLPQPRLPGLRFEPEYVEFCKIVRSALETGDRANGLTTGGGTAG